MFRDKERNNGAAVLNMYINNRDEPMACPKAGRIMRYIGKVMKNKEIADNIWRMDIATGRIFKSLPGQFINVLVNGAYEPFLRKPFSICNATNNSLTIIYKVIGKGTKAMTVKKKGDRLDFIGPLGVSYLDFYSGPAAQRSKLFLIGGGTGAASVFYLAKYFRSKKIKFTFIQGARCKAQMVAASEFKKLGCLFATDDGTLGKKGFVSDLLKDRLEDNSIIFACGPKPMFRAIKAAADEKKNIKVFASFEEYMGCGIGACLSCAIEIKTAGGSEYKRVCKDGTVFDLEDVVF